MKIQYSVNRKTEYGKFKMVERRNGVLSCSGNPGDVGWQQKIRGLIQAKEPGWAITGWVELPDVPPDIVMAFEAGYKACEKGVNIQMAVKEFCRAWGPT